MNMDFLREYSPLGAERIIAELIEAARHIKQLCHFKRFFFAVLNSEDMSEVQYAVAVDGDLRKCSSNLSQLELLIEHGVLEKRIKLEFSQSAFLIIPFFGRDAYGGAVVIEGDDSLDELEFDVVKRACERLALTSENVLLRNDILLNETMDTVLVQIMNDINVSIEMGSLSQGPLLRRICGTVRQYFVLDYVEILEIDDGQIITTQSRKSPSPDCPFGKGAFAKNLTGIFWNDIRNLDCRCDSCSNLINKLGVRSLIVSEPISWGGAVFVLACGTQQARRFNKRSIARLKLVSSTITSLMSSVVRAVDVERLIRSQNERNTQMRLSYRSTLESLLFALQSKDHETHGHSQRVLDYSLAIAERLGLSGDDLRDIRWGALLHDIGKIGVRDAVLLKPGALNGDEWAMIREHPYIGYRMVSGVRFLRDVPKMILHHHERWDGDGYPLRLSKKAIPLGARIFAVADAFDAMTSERPYKPVMDIDQAIAEIRANLGTQFCPLSATAFLDISSRELEDIRSKKVSKVDAHIL